jgi:hypothetical protein
MIGHLYDACYCQLQNQMCVLFSVWFGMQHSLVRNGMGSKQQLTGSGFVYSVSVVDDHYDSQREAAEQEWLVKIHKM